MRTQIQNEDEVWFRLHDWAKRWKAHPVVAALRQAQVLPPSDLKRYQLGTVAVWQYKDRSIDAILRLLLEKQPEGWIVTTETQVARQRRQGRKLVLTWPEVIQQIEGFEHHVTPTEQLH